MTTSTSQLSPDAPGLAARSEPIPNTRPALLERLSPRGFRLLVLCMYAAGLLLAASGVQRMASLRSNYYLGQVRARAVSPLRYGTQLPALHALTTDVSGVRIIIRADSAGDRSTSLCELAAALGSEPRVLWVSKLPTSDPCIAQEGGRSSVSATAAAELSRARWALLGADGRVLHSGWDVPDAKTLRETASLFTTGQPGPRTP